MAREAPLYTKELIHAQNCGMIKSGKKVSPLKQHKIDRINELARKHKTEGLSEEEHAEREALRREYIDSVKASLHAALSNTYIMDEKGNKTPLKKKK